MQSHNFSKEAFQIETFKWHFRNRVHKWFLVPKSCYSLFFPLEEHLFHFTVIGNMICSFSAASLWRLTNRHGTDNEKQTGRTEAQGGQNKESQGVEKINYIIAAAWEHELEQTGRPPTIITSACFFCSCKENCTQEGAGDLLLIMLYSLFPWCC